MASGTGRRNGYRVAVSTMLHAESELDRAITEAGQEASVVSHVLREL